LAVAVLDTASSELNALLLLGPALEQARLSINPRPRVRVGYGL